MNAGTMTVIDHLGGPASQDGPVGCVVRLMVAAAAGDTAAAHAEVTEHSREGMQGSVRAPPALLAVLEEPMPLGDGIAVAVSFRDGEAERERFVFVVVAQPEGWRVDLPASLAATMGGDPMEMMEQALRAVVDPLCQAMGHLGEALTTAFDGGNGDDGALRPSVRRIAADADLESSTVPDSAPVVAEVVRLEYMRRCERVPGSDAVHRAMELSVRCQFAIDPSLTPQACQGVVVDCAWAVDGADLRLNDAPADLGAESYASWERERREFTCRLPLQPPQGMFTGLAELAGRVRFAYQGGEELEIALGPIADLLGQQVRLAAFGITVEVDRDGSGNLQLRVPYGWFDRLSALAIADAAGAELPLGWSGEGDGVTSTRSYDGIPDDATILMRFWSSAGEIELPFTVIGLPLLLDE